MMPMEGMMETTPGALRKAIEEKRKSDERISRSGTTANAIIATSKDHYRAFLDSVNRAGDREIERALKRA